jgi:uncharacterized protein
MKNWSCLSFNSLIFTYNHRVTGTQCNTEVFREPPCHCTSVVQNNQTQRLLKNSLFLFVLFITFLAACNNNKQSDKTVDSEKISIDTDTSVYSSEMKRYWLVLLKKGENRNQDSTAASKIQERHLANIGRLAKEGKLIMAGPMGIDGDLRGIFILNCKDSAEVETLVKTDTAVITGRLKMEYYPWWTAKGKYIFK